MDSQSSNTKIKLGALVLMIFSSIFGFSNSLTAFIKWAMPASSGIS